MNKYPAYDFLHDMNLVDMKFIGKSVIMRFSYLKYIDDFNLLDNDNQYAIIEVRYDNIKIKKISLCYTAYFKDLSVLDLNEKNGIMFFDACDYFYDYHCYFSMNFTFKKYKWRVIDIISEDEETKCLNHNINYGVIGKACKYKGPIWSSIEDYEWNNKEEKLNSNWIELNKQAIPLELRGLPILNIVFFENTITIRILLSKEKDKYSLLEDDNHYAVLEVKYGSTIIKSMNLSEIIDLRNLTILDFFNEKNVVKIKANNNRYNGLLDICFSFRKYRWKVIDIVSHNEYLEYCDKLNSFTNDYVEIQNYKGPEWNYIK